MSTYPFPLSPAPVRWYIAPADPFNPGNCGLISYASNEMLLGTTSPENACDGPRMPKSFRGRNTASIIVVFEHSAKSGQTWTTNGSFVSTTAIPDYDNRSQNWNTNVATPISS